MPTETERAPEQDISSPEFYNLRRRRRMQTFSSAEESDGFIIPPQMFDDTSESTYSWSGAKDVPLRCDDPIKSQEVELLQEREEDNSDLSDSQTTTMTSTYIWSDVADIPLGYDYSISTSELDNLRAQGDPSDIDTPMTIEPQASSNVDGIFTYTHKATGFSGPTYAEQELAELRGFALLPATIVATQATPAGSSISTISDVPYLPRFPLEQIGALRFPMSPLLAALQEEEQVSYTEDETLLIRGGM